MRQYRILIVIGLLVVIALASVWVLRNSIIRELSGPLLAQFGLEITDVSLDAIATADASIGYLELRHESGTTIAIDELELGVRRSAGGRRRYVAERVTVTPGESEQGDPASLADVIRQVLALPDAVPMIDVMIGELRVVPYPAVEDFTWATHADEQALAARINENAIGLEIERLGQYRYDAMLEVTPEDTISQRLLISIEDTTASVRLATESDLDFDALEALADRFELLPDELAIESAAAAIRLEAGVPDDPAQPVTIGAVISPDAEWRFRYADDAEVTAVVPGVLDISASYPGGSWELAVADATLSISHPVFSGAVVTLADVACRSGLACAADARFSATGIEHSSVSAATLAAAAQLNLETGAGGVLRIVARPGATISGSEIVAGTSRLPRFGAELVSETAYERHDSGWRLSADSVDAGLDRLTAGDVVADASLFLENPVVESAKEELTARTVIYTPGIDVSYGDTALKLPGLRGDVTFAGRRIAAQLATVGLANEGRLNVAYDLSSGATELDVAGMAIDFSRQPLSARVDLPLPGFDLAAGTLAVDADFEQPPRRPLGGTISLALSDAAGFYRDIAFTGASTELELRYRPMTGIEAAPAAGAIAFVDVGVPLRNVRADYHLHIDEETVDVTGLSLDAFGGTISADPFSLGTDSEPDTVLVRMRSLDIAEMLTVNEFKAVDVSGKVDADLPLRVSPDGVTMEGGRLTGLSPGGVIRYRAGAAAAGDNSPMGIAQQALSNFEYETLTADVDYDKDGNLVVQMQLRGRNPDMEGSRPVVLNLGVENNIPQMLRSLQASRNVQDVLERRVNR